MLQGLIEFATIILTSRASLKVLTIRQQRLSALLLIFDVHVGLALFPSETVC